MTEQSSYEKIGLFEVLFLLGLFMKQFYLQSSGSLQVGDILMGSSIFYLFFKHRLRISQKDNSLIVFVIFTFAINGLYFIYYDGGFIKSSFYLLFNLIIVISFRLMIQSKFFVKCVMTVMKINLATQFVIYFIGAGRYFGGSRYEGTFNDPNQFSFFVLASFFIIYLCSLYQKTKLHIVWYIIVAFLVVISTSTGMILAFLIFLFSTVIYPFFKEKQSSISMTAFFLLIIVTVILFIKRNEIILMIRDTVNWKSLTRIIDRFYAKMDKASDTEGGLLRDRLLMRVIRAPYFFIFGCGEGNFLRFIPISNEQGEIHCTMLALCYYYGIIPYSFFLRWLYNNLKGVPYKSISVFIAIILEALTLANHRQPFFWIIFVLGSLLASDNETQKNQQRSECNFESKL